MNPEERSLLEKTYALAEENNTLLKKIHRSNRFSLIVKSIYWFLIIGLSVGAFYFIQPYINSLTGTVGGDSVNTKGVSPLQSYTQNLESLLK